MGLAFRVQEILQDGGLFTGDIVVIVIYFIGKRSLKSTRHHENNKDTKENEMGEMRRLTQSRLCIICYGCQLHRRAWVSMCKGVPHGLINFIATKAKCRQKKLTCKGICYRCLSGLGHISLVK
jgi:hypothetical protein